LPARFAVASTISEAKEMAESNLRERMRNLERGQDAGVCPIRYKLWARGINGEYLVATTIGSYGNWHKPRMATSRSCGLLHDRRLTGLIRRDRTLLTLRLLARRARKGIRNDLGTEDVLRTEIGPAGTGPGF
jgi:hypothetical protein